MIDECLELETRSAPDHAASVLAKTEDLHTCMRPMMGRARAHVRDHWQPLWTMPAIGGRYADVGEANADVSPPQIEMHRPHTSHGRHASECWQMLDWIEDAHAGWRRRDVRAVE